MFCYLDAFQRDFKGKNENLSQKLWMIGTRRLKETPPGFICILDFK